MPAGEKLWWETDVPDDVRRLARAICANPDQMVVPHSPYLVEQPGGLCAVVDPKTIAPYWTRFRSMAEMALRLAREDIERARLTAEEASAECSASAVRV